MNLEFAIVLNGVFLSSQEEPSVGLTSLAKDHILSGPGGLLARLVLGLSGVVG